MGVLPVGSELRAACQAFVAGPLRTKLEALAAALPGNASSLRIAPDAEDPDGQSLLLWYPTITGDDDGYITPAVKIEAGAKSALDPHAPATVTPYIGDDLVGFDLAVPGVITVDPIRTFWDKVVILHGLRRWFERRGELRGGQRISRHYYDIDRLLNVELGRRATADLAMARDCTSHARMFFNRPDLDLATATPGSYALVPHDDMLANLAQDYNAISRMIFGEVPAFGAVIDSIVNLERHLNG